MTQPPQDPRAQGKPPPAGQEARPPAGQRTSRLSAPQPRSHFTGRAAIVAIVLCGIALSLAYPVREYISQRRQIDQLEALSAQIQMRRAELQRESKLLHSPAYIAEQARDRLHMCLPTQVCYVIIGDPAKRKPPKAHPVATPWYAKVWSSVQQANAAPVGTGHPDIRPKGTRRPGGLPARRVPASRPGHRRAGRRAAGRGGGATARRPDGRRRVGPARSG